MKWNSNGNVVLELNIHCLATSIYLTLHKFDVKRLTKHFIVKLHLL